MLFPPMLSLKSWFKPSRTIEMPGSPYLDEPPKGLWTWPRLLRVAGVPLTVFLGACAYYRVLVEALAIITATVLVATWLKR